MHYSINHERRLIFAQAPADLAYRNVLQDEAEVAHREDYVRDYARVFDFTNVSTLDVQTREFVDFVRATRALDISDDARVALVGRHESTMRVLHLFASHFVVQPVRVFQDVDRAIGWAVAGEEPAAEGGHALLEIRNAISLSDLVDACLAGLGNGGRLLVDLRAANVASVATITEQDSMTRHHLGEDVCIAFAVRGHLMSLIASRALDILGASGGVFRSLNDAATWLDGQG